MKRLTLLLSFFIAFSTQAQTCFFVDSTKNAVKYIQAFEDSTGKAFVHKFKLPYGADWSQENLKTIMIKYRKPGKGMFHYGYKYREEVPLAYNSCAEALEIHNSHFNRKANGFLIPGGIYLLSSIALGSIAIKLSDPEGQGQAYGAVFGVMAGMGGAIGLGLTGAGVVVKLKSKKRQKTLVCP